jgi:hypothetical protein
VRLSITPVITMWFTKMDSNVCNISTWGFWKRKSRFGISGVSPTTMLPSLLGSDQDLCSSSVREVESIYTMFILNNLCISYGTYLS